jgi:hypothetical protein
MARIRSVHPGLFTDEAFVVLSDAAQIFLIGLWTECDDQGVFEWKPTMLRMRVRPAKDGSVDDLLSELKAVDIIASYELDGRKYGAVRNFRKFQRPKKPNAIHPINGAIRTYVGLAGRDSELEQIEAPPSSEIPPQMERRMEEGGGGEEEKKDLSADAARKSYFFEAGVIRLNERDFRKWEDAYNNLELKAELIGLASWAEQQGSKWFHAVPGALTKRNRQIANERRNGGTKTRVEGIL